MRMQRLTTDGEGQRSTGDSPMDEYIDQCLAYLDGERPAPPSPEGLTAEDRAEAEAILKVFGLHWGSKAAEAATTTSAFQDAPAATRPEVFVAHHCADRGWANWITYELESVGYRCAASATDPAAGAVLLGWVADMRVITIASHRSLATDAAWPTSLSPRAVGDKDWFVVRVDDCELHGLDPSRQVDLAGCSEPDARQALLQRVAGQPRVQRPTTAQRFGSALELWLQRLERELASPTDNLLLSLFVLSDPDQDHLVAATTAPRAAETPALLVSGDEPPWVPRLLRETIRDWLSPEARDRCLELAAELASLAEVNVQLRSFEQAYWHHQQAWTIRELAHGGQPGGQSGSCPHARCATRREVASCG